MHQLGRCQLQLVEARGSYNCAFLRLSRLVAVAMAVRSPHFTASQAGDLVTAEDDTEFLFSGSDDDFDAGLLVDEHDPLDREQGK